MNIFRRKLDSPFEVFVIGAAQKFYGQPESSRRKHEVNLQLNMMQNSWAKIIHRSH